MLTGGEIVFAASAGNDDLELSWKEAKDILESCELNIDTPYKIEFGIKKWKSMLGIGSHRAVMIKVLKENMLAFRLELMIDVSREDRYYIAGNFKCPDCGLDTDSFREYTSHYYSHYCQGENVTHVCCGDAFADFPVYCKHVYEKHQNIRRVKLYFNEIMPQGYDRFLNKDTVTFFPNDVRKVSFRQLFDAAISIMSSFGNYFVFFWNCQDFAAWFLSYNGIPLNKIEPTVSDKITGSGSSNRSVQHTRGWMWYKKPEQLKKLKLDKYGGEVMCNYPKCKYLPAMSLNDLILHNQIAHSRE